MMNDEKQPVALKDALAMLPPGDAVHTFRNPAGFLIGADWNKEAIAEWMLQHEVELSGPLASSMGHGLAGFDDDGLMFIETVTTASVSESTEAAETNGG